MEVSICAAATTDVETLVALSERTIRADYTSFLGDRSVAAYIASGAVESFVRQSVGRCQVINTDGRPAGYCVFSGPMIEILMIDHDFHGRGLGSQLLQHCEQHLFAQHVELSLESFAPNDKANRFYRLRGWTEADRAPDEASGVDKITFRKRRGEPGQVTGQAHPMDASDKTISRPARSKRANSHRRGL